MNRMRVKRCVFCGTDSSASKSIEHIIPESLGNNTIFLEKGVVCDKCNNYFASKIEEKLLSLDVFKQVRFYNFVESKNGRIPTSDALFCGERAKVDWVKTEEGFSMMIGLTPESIVKVMNNPPKCFFMRGYDMQDVQKEANNQYIFSRFLAKMAVEYYVYLYLNSCDQNEEVEFEFDSVLKKVINFVRVGRQDARPLKFTIEKVQKTKDDYYLSIGFDDEKDDLVFFFQIMNDRFLLNLTNNVYSI